MKSNRVEYSTRHIGVKEDDLNRVEDLIRLEKEQAGAIYLESCENLSHGITSASAPTGAYNKKFKSFLLSMLTFMKLNNWFIMSCKLCGLVSTIFFNSFNPLAWE